MDDTDSLADFMKKELIRYVNDERKKGHPLWAIKKSLLQGGHHKNLIEEAIEDLKKHDFKVDKAIEEPVAASLKGELRHDVHEALKKYVAFQKGKGYSLAEIREILTHYGHSNEDIKAAFEAVEGHKPMHHHHDETLGHSSLLILSSVIVSLVIFLFFLAVSSGDEIHKVIVGSLPTIITVLLAVYMVKRLPDNQRVAIWIVPLVLSGLLFITGLNDNAGMVSRMDTSRLAVVNLVISLIYLNFITKLPHDGRPPKGTKAGKSDEGEVPSDSVTQDEIKQTV